MPRRYQLILHGWGFHAPDDATGPIEGFYTACRIIAEGDGRAGELAIENLRQNPKVRALYDATREHLGHTDACEIAVDECFEIGWWRWTRTRKPEGFIFYGGDDDKNNRETEQGAAGQPATSPRVGD